MPFVSRFMKTLKGKILIGVVAIVTLIAIAVSQDGNQPSSQTQHYPKVASPTVNANLSPSNNTEALDLKLSTPTPSVQRVDAEPVETSQAPLAPNGTYENVDGNQVPSPYYAPSVPAGATAQCRDGTYSFSQHRQGTCSHHGGVSEWF